MVEDKSYEATDTPKSLRTVCMRLPAVPGISDVTSVPVRVLGVEMSSDYKLVFDQYQTHRVQGLESVLDRLDAAAGWTIHTRDGHGVAAVPAIKYLRVR